MLQSHRAGERPAFTLVEMLVVISITAVLIALVTSAAFKVMEAQQRSNTRTVLARADGRLRQQMAYIRDRYGSANPGTVAQNLAGGDLDRARVVQMKLAMRKYFPTTYWEVFNPGTGNVVVTSYRKFLTDRGITSGSATAPAAHESAACLYMILRHGPETTGEGDLGMAGSERTVNNVPVLIDGWGRPLVFCRWPTGNASGVSGLSGGYQTGFHDPVDTRGQLTAASFVGNATLRTAFIAALHNLPTPADAGKSLKLQPVVVSVGRDGVSGLDQNLAVTNQTAANDNIYSIEVR